MSKLIVLTWLLTSTITLFVLATEMWAGIPRSTARFTGAAILSILAPLGTWLITKRRPETEKMAWYCLTLTGLIIAGYAIASRLF